MRLAWLLFLTLYGLCSALEAEREWSKVRSFCYQLQGISLQQIEQSPYDILITDYTSDGSTRWTRKEVARLQSGKGGKRRLVLAYLSIGEAETYRFYWKSHFRPNRPAWLEKANPEWGGNHKVRFWHSDWQKILNQYLDQIVAAGFDGVYLDIIDAYEYFEEKGRSQARSEMIQLVVKLAGYARKRAGADFGIFPQNGEALLRDKTYLTTITGIGKEDLYYGYHAVGRASPPAITSATEKLLDLAIQANRLVLNVDYTNNPGQARQAYSRARARRYLEFVAPRELNRLLSFPGLQPPDP